MFHLEFQGQLNKQLLQILLNLFSRNHFVTLLASKIQFSETTCQYSSVRHLSPVLISIICVKYTGESLWKRIRCQHLSPYRSYLIFEIWRKKRRVGVCSQHCKIGADHGMIRFDTNPVLSGGDSFGSCFFEDLCPL